MTQLSTSKALKDYSGSVYGGLGQLLYGYCQAKGIAISPQLQQLQQVERFEFSVWRERLDEIAQHSSSPALGLEIAEYIQPKHLGVMAYIAMSCHTLAEALARYHHFYRLIYDGSHLEIEVKGPLLHIRWAELPAHLVTPLTAEIAVALLAQFLKQFLDIQKICFEQVNFAHHSRKTLVYEQYFGCNVKFGQAHTELILPLKILQQPIRQADPTLEQLLMQQAQALLDKLPHSTQLDQRLQQAILLGLQRNNYQIEHIADQLKLSVRQLQRHLQQQNSRYQHRVQQVRHMLAVQYLQDPHLSLHEIALLLSYSEQSAFQRAFKQWTGQTPRQWRKQVESAL